MDLLTRDFAAELLIPPIAGGDGTESAEGADYEDQPAGDVASGADSGEESAEQQLQDGEQQPQDGQQDPQSPDGQPQAGDAFGGQGGTREPQMIPYSRFKEINDRLRTVDAERAMLLGRVAGGQQGPTGAPNGPAQAPQIPEQYKELDKGMGGYMRHYLDPFAAHIMEQRDTIGDMRDESRFYRGSGRGLNEEQAQMVEQAREGLSRKLNQPVERADVLNWLKGDAKYAAKFADPRATANQQLAEGVVAARRSAGKVGARAPVTRGRDPGAIDLNKLPRSQRIKEFERIAGDTAV